MNQYSCKVRQFKRKLFPHFRASRVSKHGHFRLPKPVQNYCVKIVWQNKNFWPQNIPCSPQKVCFLPQKVRFLTSKSSFFDRSIILFCMFCIFRIYGIFETRHVPCVLFIRKIKCINWF